MRASNLTIVVLAFLVAAPAFGAEKKLIVSSGAKPVGNHSQGILSDGTLYISRQAGENAAGKIPGDFEAEVKQCLDYIGASLKAAGMSPTDVVSEQVNPTDATKFDRMNAVYTTYFKEPRLTPTTVVVGTLAGPGNIEVTVTAKKMRAGMAAESGKSSTTHEKP